MISGYANEQTEQLDKRGYASGVPEDVAKAAGKVFDKMHAAIVLQDLLRPPRGHIAKVPGSHPARLRIHILNSWWLSFIWQEPNCLDVKLEH